MGERSTEDQLADLLRIQFRGPARILWEDIPEESQELWRAHSRELQALMKRRGLKVVEGDGKDE